MEHLVAFYRRVRPPGFWGPVARAAGIPGRGRRRASSAAGLSATAIAALSIFCVLIALGSWIAGSPAPGWVGHRGVWLATLLAVGLLLVPDLVAARISRVRSSIRDEPPSARVR